MGQFCRNGGIEVLPALRGVVGDRSWCRKAAGCEGDTVRVSSSDLIGNRAGPKVVIDNSVDTGDELLSAPPLSLINNYISAEERLSVKTATETGYHHGLNTNLAGSPKSRTPVSYDEPIELDGDAKPEDDDNLENIRGLRIAPGRQLDYDAFNQEHMLTLSNHMVYGNDTGVDNSEGRQTIKRQRFSPALSRSILCQTITPPRPHNEDDTGSNEIVSHSDPKESSDDNICSKRRKSSAPARDVTPSDYHHHQSRPWLPILEDEDYNEDDGTPSSLADNNFATTTPASQSAKLTVPQLYPQVINIDHDWEAREIIGRGDVDGVHHYLMDWHLTLLPEHSLGDAKELVDKFETRLRARRGVGDGRGRLGLKQDVAAWAKAAPLGGLGEKKLRGRPRKRKSSRTMHKRLPEGGPLQASVTIQ
ncbi:hypothetical protein B0O99DRAFT_600499 [Bisporella sp. PMI_857]|nr:hypothetical protein B0O99DRAFT_600499 [Bisporella sp. PMI_857]